MKKRHPAYEITGKEEAEIQRGIARDADNPELTDEQLARMRPAREVLPPELYDALVKHQAGRPKAAQTRQLISLRLEKEVVDKFRATGRAGRPG